MRVKHIIVMFVILLQAPQGQLDGTRKPNISEKYYVLVSDKRNIAKGTRTQALTALTSNLGLVGSVQCAWQIWFDKFGLVGLDW